MPVENIGLSHDVRAVANYFIRNYIKREKSLSTFVLTPIFLEAMVVVANGIFKREFDRRLVSAPVAVAAGRLYFPVLRRYLAYVGTGEVCKLLSLSSPAEWRLRKVIDDPVPSNHFTIQQERVMKLVWDELTRSDVKPQNLYLLLASGEPAKSEQREKRAIVRESDYELLESEYLLASSDR